MVEFKMSDKGDCKAATEGEVLGECIPVDGLLLLSAAGDCHAVSLTLGRHLTGLSCSDCEL
jgi:hypothetical protein